MTNLARIGRKMTSDNPRDLESHYLPIMLVSASSTTENWQVFSHNFQSSSNPKHSLHNHNASLQSLLKVSSFIHLSFTMADSQRRGSRPGLVSLAHMSKSARTLRTNTSDELSSPSGSKTPTRGNFRRQLPQRSVSQKLDRRQVVAPTDSEMESDESEQ
ncbi:expressed unknown protein [Seminavis robusta]|uniref:Uncharacterized protein n=1 Tax=Seminavis robusta TaxID=568900 RepID=A0A9N8DHG1_9STRA|nr:expressed unknown protein [Seminavis robusta]|eukprot:Sro161_g285761.1  (159) ;mRNA; f:1339-1815